MERQYVSAYYKEDLSFFFYPRDTGDGLNTIHVIRGYYARSFVALFQRISILGCFFSSRVSESNFHRLKEGDSRLLPSSRSLFLRLRRHAPAVSPLKARSFEFLIHRDYITIMAIRVPLLPPC